MFEQVFVQPKFQMEHPVHSDFPAVMDRVFHHQYIYSIIAIFCEQETDLAHIVNRMNLLSFFLYFFIQ